MALTVPGRRSALVLLLAAGGPELAAAGLSLAVLSAAEGRYSPTQFLLDVGQGARVSASAYPGGGPPSLALRLAGAQGLESGWSGARARAAAAPAQLTPGLLAGRIPGGAGYASTAGESGLGSILAADPRGRISAVTIGAPQTLVERTLALLGRHRLVVAELPGGPSGLGDLRRLLRRRPPGALVIALQHSAAGPGASLLWAGAAGLGPPSRELTSASTEQRGLIASVDLAPTVLRWLGLKRPAQMTGRPIESSGRLDTRALSALLSRLRALGGRRLRALGFLLCAWLALALACSRSQRGRAWAMRTGALAVMWTAPAAMAVAALDPSAPAEYGAIALLCLGLGALSDRLFPWPLALIAPALAAPLAITGDALAHSQLLLRSLLGPDPALGARFYGIGNELKSGLAVLVLAGLAAALHPAARKRRARPVILLGGLALALIEGSARLGAAVGGVILVCAGVATALVVLAPGGLNRPRALIVLCAPLGGLAALAALDLAFAHGSGHFNGSILEASSAGELRDLIARRYEAAWAELGNHAMPVACALALGLAGLGLRRRTRLPAPAATDPVWQAALAGGLAAGLAGTLTEDSGPVLLVVAVFVLGCVLSYLSGRPRAPLRVDGGEVYSDSLRRRLTSSTTPTITITTTRMPPAI